VKGAFYNELQATGNRIPTNDMLVIAGDWNGRTGIADEQYRTSLGPFGVGRRCTDGDRLINLAHNNHLMVLNTLKLEKIDVIQSSIFSVFRVRLERF